MTNFHTVDVIEAKACLPLKDATCLVCSNRGDKTHAGDIELCLDNSDDTFLLKFDERQEFNGKFSQICFKRVDGKDKIRLDIFEA